MTVRLFLIVGAVLIGALLKTIAEHGLCRSQEPLRLGGPVLTLEIRDQIGQGTALALLSGFRGIVADFIWVAAHAAWERQDWVRMRPLLELACVLQPRAVIFWENASWHMAWNISSAVLHDPTEPRAAMRIKASRQWILAGSDLLDRGIRNNPDLWDLWFAKGWLLDQKLGDLQGAIEFYRKAGAFPEAPPHVHRLIGYRLEQLGHKREAYDYWCKLWNSYPDKSDPLMLWEKIESHLRRLEQELNIPPSGR